MVTEIVNVFTTVFTAFPAALAGMIVDMFDGLFVDGTGLTNLAQGLLTFAAIGLVIGALFMVYAIFRTRVRKRL